MDPDATQQVVPGVNLTQQVFVIADDPIEAGMLALDLVHAGMAAQAVRDGTTLLTQLTDVRDAQSPVVVSAFRDLSQTLDLSGQLAESGLKVRVIAVVLRSQRDAAERQGREHGWAGVAVRPVNAEELVAIVGGQTKLQRMPSGGSPQEGELGQARVLDVLAGLIDRIPRPGGGKNAVLELESHGRVAKIAIVEGELVHAEADGETGRHVLERVACWRTGSWRIEPQVWTGTATLTGSSIGLLAVAQEYDRRVEEARNNLPYTDCKCTVRWERVRPLPVVAEAMFRRIAAGSILAEALAGEGDDELEAYAALENRIKRGAVVPQIETSTAPLSGETPLPHAALASNLPSAAARTSAILTTMTPESETRRAHPNTHLYQLNETPQHANPNLRDSDMPPALPLGQTPPGLPNRPQSGIHASAASRLPTGVVRTNSAAALDTNRYNPMENAARRGAVTGWFGVAMAEGEEAAADAPLRSSARMSESSRNAAAPRSTPRHSTPRVGSAPGEEAPRLAARPYAWTDNPHERNDSEEVELPKAAQLRGTSRTKWLLSGGAVVLSLLVALAWPSHPKNSRRAPGQEFRRASNLIEAGQFDDAIKRLQGLIQTKDFEPEAMLSLGVLEIEARQFSSGRAHLEAYLALPTARHVDRAQKLFQHVFGAPPSTLGQPSTPGQQLAATPTAG